jgi:hypothetical protein
LRYSFAYECHYSEFGYTYFTRANERGEYKLENLPDGVYEVTIYHPDFDPLVEKVEIKNGASGQTQLQGIGLVMRLNIQTKLFINIAGLILVILAGVAIVTNNSVITLVEQKVIDDFRQTQIPYKKSRNCATTGSPNRLCLSEKILFLKPTWN